MEGYGYGMDMATAGWAGLVAALTTALMGLLNWWLAARRDKAETKINERASRTSDEQTQTAIEAHVQTVYGGIIADMQERMNHLVEQEKNCRMELASLRSRVAVIEAAYREPEA